METSHVDEGVAFSGIVNLGDFSALAELVLEDLMGAVPVHPVNEKLYALRHGACFGYKVPFTRKLAEKIASSSAVSYFISQFSSQ